MKGLLHSKRLKKNLCKWVIMYVGVIGLLTTVITYSKFISNLESGDSARVAKFGVTITPQEACQLTADKVCNTNRNYRPTSNINYSFVVDTSDIEVKTDLVLTILSHEEFNLVSLTDENGNKVTTTPAANSNNYNAYSIKRVVDSSTNKNKKTYKVTVRYSKNDTSANGKKYDIVKVGYSAKQITR